MNATEPYWWWVNIDLGNGLVLWGYKSLLEPMLTPIAVCCHTRRHWVKMAVNLPRPQRVKLLIKDLLYTVDSLQIHKILIQTYILLKSFVHAMTVQCCVLYSNHLIRIQMRVKWIAHQLWIMMRTESYKWKNYNVMKRYVTGCKHFRDTVLETEFSSFVSQSDHEPRPSSHYIFQSNSKFNESL